MLNGTRLQPVLARKCPQAALPVTLVVTSVEHIHDVLEADTAQEWMCRRRVAVVVE